MLGAQPHCWFCHEAAHILFAGFNMFNLCDVLTAQMNLFDLYFKFWLDLYFKFWLVITFCDLVGKTNKISGFMLPVPGF